VELTIDENTKVRCTHHLDEELYATYAIDRNILLISPCQKCVEEAKQQKK
jgi:hypothetical protein